MFFAATLPAANPDLGGWIGADAGLSLSRFKQTGQWTNPYGVPIKVDFKGDSLRFYGLSARGPLTEWFSTATSLGWTQLSNLYREDAGNNGSLGTYEHRFNLNRDYLSFGFAFYPAPLFGARQRLGQGNPDGPRWYPALQARYYRGGGQARYLVSQASLGYAGSTLPTDYDERWEGYSLRADWPVSSSLTLTQGLQQQTWYQSYDKNYSFSQANGFQTYELGLTYYLALGDPELVRHPYVQMPHQGGPKSLRFDVGYSHENWLNVAEAGGDAFWLASRYAFNSAFALGLSYSLYTQANKPIRFNGFTTDNAALTDSSVALELQFNIASGNWRGFTDQEIVVTYPMPPAPPEALDPEEIPIPEP